MISHSLIKVISLFILITFSLNVTANISIQDSNKIHHFKAPPSRVVALNWDLLEQVLALNITPVGAPEIASYRQWVVKPIIPEKVVDIGSRTEPNLETIAGLQPDVILAAAPQQDLIPLLEQIAPVIFLPNFAKSDDGANTAIKHLYTLGKLFQKEAVVQEKLAEIHSTFSTLRKQIQAHFSFVPEVVVMRFSTLNSVFLYTENSTTNYVIKQLGLKNPISIEAKSWGIKQERINRLQHINKGYVLYVLPFPDEVKLKTAPLWQAMPFVKKGRVNSVQNVWNYGGALSLQYMAEAITNSLVSLESDE